MSKRRPSIKDILDEAVAEYNRPSFIDTDPISIPHRYTKLQDIEISGLFAAVFSWGQRKTIINKTNELMSYMDNAPYDFILHHQEDDLKPLLAFKHRTFQPTDTLYFITFLQDYYRREKSLENAFTMGDGTSEWNAYDGIAHFHETFFSLVDAPHRTKKHVSTPTRNSSCKRLNMYLRWMVRHDKMGVDFGIWKNIPPSQLMIPLDVHVYRVAHKLGLLTRTKSDWKAVEELTSSLRKFDPVDPVKYDFALFNMSISGNLNV